VGRQDADDYAGIVAEARRAMLVDPTPVVAAGRARLRHLADEQRYEQAARQRDRVAAFLRGAARAQRIRALAACAEISVAAPSEGRTAHPSWDLVVIRHGRLAGSATVAHGPRLRPALDALIATSARVHPDGSGLPVGHIDETLALLAWLDRPGVRLAGVEGVWSLPVGSAVRAAVDYAWPRVLATHRSSSAAAAPLSMAAAARFRA
jgi:DNA polymerase-3 subunit epsilon